MTGLSARRHHRKRYQDLKARGICVKCCNKEAKDGVHCPECTKKNQKANVLYRVKAKAKFKKNNCPACHYG